MLGRQNAVSVAEAQRRMEEHVAFREPSSVPIALDRAPGRVLSDDIISPEDLPAFSRSTVDGFAVRSTDTFGASESIPAYLTVTNRVAMGEEPGFSLEKGTAAEIATGAMLPLNADAVVMIEHTQAAGGMVIEVSRPVAPGENVISKGEDMRRGEVILRKGHVLRPQDIGALAGVGLERIMVYEQPRVSIISTGDEVVPVERKLTPGQVRDINSFTLAGLVQEHGCIPIKKGIHPDVYEVIRDVVASSLGDSDVVLISGGSSVGTKDLTADIVNSLGSPGVLFHGVALKPGKPTIGAVVNGIPVFGLPGHPAAVAVCFEIFVLPLLRKLRGEQGKEYLGKGMVKARLARNLSSDEGREEHIRVLLEERDGELWAVPVLGKSGLIRTLVNADGTVRVPLSVRGIEAGETVEVQPF